MMLDLKKVAYYTCDMRLFTQSFVSSSIHTIRTSFALFLLDVFALLLFFMKRQIKKLIWEILGDVYA